MKHKFDGYKCILLFDLKAQLPILLQNLKAQLPILLQNVCEVNRERSRLAAASSNLRRFRVMHRFDPPILKWKDPPQMAIGHTGHL